MNAIDEIILFINNTECRYKSIIHHMRIFKSDNYSRTQKIYKMKSIVNASVALYRKEVGDLKINDAQKMQAASVLFEQYYEEIKLGNY